MARDKQVSIKIGEDRDRAVALEPRAFLERHAARHKPLLISPKIIRFEKRKDAPAGLVADPRLLLRRVGPRQQQAEARRRSGRNPHPALAGFERGILSELESERADKLAEGLVVGHPRK